MASAPSAATKPAPIIKLRERNGFFICLLQPGGGSYDLLYPPCGGEVTQGTAWRKRPKSNSAQSLVAKRRARPQDVLSASLPTGGCNFLQDFGLYARPGLGC